MAYFRGVRWATLALAYLALSVTASDRLRVQISVGDKKLLKGAVDGRVVLMFAPNGTDPLEDTDVTSTPNKMFGKNVFGFGARDKVVLSGGSPDNTATGVSGFPLVSMDDVPEGVYTVQAFLNPYDRAKRSDGSVVHLKFPCGDGAPNVDGVESLTTPAVSVKISGKPQTINLAFDSVVSVEAFAGKEIGGCSQGNYADTPLLKYVKIRSTALSRFWGRDMYVGANVLLPAGYNAADKKTRYPVLYNQNHWTGGRGPYRYSSDAAFTQAWDQGIIPGANGTADKPAPKMIIVAFRHEAPYYDDSYGVNTANMGPYGDAINDELIPYIDKKFNTIAQPYARIQDGGSTGGWISAASVIFRPDLFGACFSSYPDSLDFHRHQDIDLYSYKSAYKKPSGAAIGSIRTFASPTNDTPIVLATVEQENHWELVFGTASRSSLQWDVWNAVFGVQGLNGYPLEPWDKVTGEIYPESVAYWKELGMDLSDYIASNWGSSSGKNKGKGTGKNLGKALRGRIFIYVGTHDNYYLNGGVTEFEKRVNGRQLGGPGWANVTILPGQNHGGNYQRRATWDYLQLVDQWVRDHAPSGKSPLSKEATRPEIRGNRFEDVLRLGGHVAALKRQARPSLSLEEKVKTGTKVTATPGRWDPGVKLMAQWVVDGRLSGPAFPVTQGQMVKYVPSGEGDGYTTGKKRSFKLKLLVTGSKRNYADETRESNVVVVVSRR
ncbi:Alpha/Beta hydrolase protein [Xylariaceae sp. FL0594]|nr:Alpha/Beta hydrolase protein [Xylariaceae sp. FL0594]